jgi:2-polyprenyl-3-methyl-5-hydroxy-6-metoxy-1,4-benzoquinol methylase
MANKKVQLNHAICYESYTNFYGERKMIEATAEYLANIESEILSGSSNSAIFSKLRNISFDNFAELSLDIPSSKYPKLSNMLPHKTDEKIQVEWTGSSGLTLLRQSISFVNYIVSSYASNSKKPLRKAVTLDFGCGWGRIIRLLPYYIDSNNLYGCDAWDVSLKHAMAAKISARFAKSAVVVDDLPFEKISFDLIYAFSVFTHLPDHVAFPALNAMRRRISDDGLVIITVRPLEYWSQVAAKNKDDVSALIQAHEIKGYAFDPATSNEPKSNYGNASMTRAYLEEKLTDWKIVSMGNTLMDQYQVFVCLKPC